MILRGDVTVACEPLEFVILVRIQAPQPWTRSKIGSRPWTEFILVHGQNRANFMYYAYVLQSLKDGKLYIGFTKDLKRRMQEHKSGGSVSTKKRLPFRLVFYEAFVSEGDAKRRERYFKTTKGKKALKLILRESVKWCQGRNPGLYYSYILFCVKNSPRRRFLIRGFISLTQFDRKNMVRLFS